MEDRELLEAAAKAAGFKINARFQAQRDAAGFGHVGLAIIDHSTGWNPLKDDGDAFRLAVQMGVSLNADEPISVGAFEYQGHKEGEYEQGVQAWIVKRGTSLEITSLEIEEVYGSDRRAATRRAIVRCAAALAGGGSDV